MHCIIKTESVYKPKDLLIVKLEVSEFDSIVIKHFAFDRLGIFPDEFGSKLNGCTLGDLLKYESLRVPVPRTLSCDIVWTHILDFFMETDVALKVLGTHFLLSDSQGLTKDTENFKDYQWQ